MRQTPKLFLSALFTILSFGATAQISIGSLPYSPATTGFNLYNPSTSANLLATIPAGWAVSSSILNVYNGRANGASTIGGYYAFGSTGDFNLGAFRTASVGDITYTVSFVNNSGSTINTLTLSWDYEQFRYANTSGWTVSGTGALAGNTTLSTKSFTGSPTGTNTVVSNTSVASFNLTGLNILDNQSFGIQWTTNDDAGNDNAVGIDNFSISAISGNPMPIDLLTFDAQAGLSNDHLSWATTCTSTARRFTVERSNDGSAFKSVTELAAHTNICDETRKYDLTVPTLVGERWLYRLAMMEASGAITYSPIVSLFKAPHGGHPIITVSPVPVRNTLLVNGAERGAPWHIYNLQGDMTSSGIYSGGIDVSRLTTGLHLLQVVGASPIRFIKE